MDGHTVGQAQTAVPVLIHLKDPSWFPHQKQYPLKPEVKEGLIPIIKDLKRQGLLQNALAHIILLFSVSRRNLTNGG
jgi:hypothetical protein